MISFPYDFNTSFILLTICIVFLWDIRLLLSNSNGLASAAILWPLRFWFESQKFTLLPLKSFWFSLLGWVHYPLERVFLLGP